MLFEAYLYKSDTSRSGSLMEPWRDSPILAVVEWSATPGELGEEFQKTRGGGKLKTNENENCACGDHERGNSRRSWMLLEN
jgi:hypothetical protein